MTLRNFDTELDIRGVTRMVVTRSTVLPVEAPVVTAVSCSHCAELEAEIEYLQGFLSAKERVARESGDEVQCHADDPQTSKMAARLLSGPRRWRTRLMALEPLIYSSEHPFSYEHPYAGLQESNGGITDDELQYLPPPVGLGFGATDAYSTYRTCRIELRDLLIVRAIPGARRPSWAESNRTCYSTVWQTVPDAMTRFEMLREEASEQRLQRLDAAARFARAVGLMRELG